MGLRIDLYAVDLPIFTDWVERSIYDVLTFYSVAGIDSDLHITFTERQGTYISIPRRGVFSLQDSLTPIPSAQAIMDPMLQQSLRTYLNTTSSYRFSHSLSRLSRCEGLDWVRRVSLGSRRWWIGSLLQTMGQRPYMPPADHQRAVHLFQRILRLYDCGVPLPASSYTLQDIPFPVTPADDTDQWMGIWTDDDLLFMQKLIEEILSQRPTFWRLATFGIGPETDAEWDAWVCTELEAIAQISSFGFTTPYLVSFIDS